MVETPSNELSERELEILKLVATGASNKEIAVKLVISPNTVKVHLRNIFSKIGVQSRTEAAMYAVRTGLVEASSQLVNFQQLPISSAQPMDVNRLIDWVRRNRALVTLGILLLLSLVIILQLILNRPNANSQTFQPTPTFESHWKRLADMPTPRANLAAVAYENKIYAVGGETAKGVTGSFERFDPITNQWVQLEPKPLPVADIKAVFLNNKLYIPGGITSDGGLTADVDVFDLNLNQWEKAAPLPMPVSGYSISVFRDKIYLFGGWDGKKVLDTILSYNPSEDAWTFSSRLSSPRAGSGVIISSEKVFLFGGWDGKSSVFENEKLSVEDLSNPEPQWEKTSIQMGDLSSVEVASIADFIFIIKKGIAAQQNTDPFGIFYNEVGLTIGELYEPPVPDWRNMAVTALGDKLFFFGGMNLNGYLSINYSYQAVQIISIPFVR